MNEAVARQIEEILRRLDQLEASSVIGYQKGAYTPTYTGGTTAGTTTYTTQIGFYTRVGRLMFFNGRIVWTAATGTGTAIISLPAASVNSADMRYGVMLKTDGVTFANGSIQGRIAPGDTVFRMSSPATNAASADIAVEAAGDVTFSGFYYV
jgi:hypothetical protein